MNKRKQNITILVVLLILTSIAGVAYWLWVKSIALPIIGNIEDYEAETISGEEFKIEDGKIKLFTVVESGCPPECEDMFAELEQLQQDLIDEKAFVARAHVLTIVENESDINTLKEYPEKYNMDENGWNILLLPQDDRQRLLESITETKENSRALTLVDATGKVRQHYNIEVQDEKEQLLKDVAQLIRIQQQSIEERR